MSKVDLRELAVDRGDHFDTDLRHGRRWFTRYILPAALFIGFGALAAWAGRDFLFAPVSVQVIPVHSVRLAAPPAGTQLFSAAGWIEPRPTAVRVAALSSGVVEKLLVVEDQSVSAGDPIAELVKDDAQLALAAAEAESKLREAELQEAQAVLVAAETRLKQPVHLQAQLSEAEMGLARIDTQLRNLPHETRRAEAKLELASQNLRAKSNSEGAVSGLQLAQARSEMQEAEALVAELKDRRTSLENERVAARATRDALKTQLELLADEIRARDEAKAKVAAAASRLEQATVAVAEAKLRLDRMTIRAPVNGRVYRLVGQPGTTLTGGMGLSEQFDGSTVVTLYRPEMLQARVDVRFEDIPRVTLGQPVQIENAALNQPIAGKVLFVSSQANIQKNTLEVKVEIEAPPAVLKPEMLVNVRFAAPAGVAHSENEGEKLRIYVPQQHVHRDNAGAFVWVPDQSAGVARRMSVVASAAALDGLVEVESGLTIASRVIADHNGNLVDGARIRIVGESPESGRSIQTTESPDPSLQRMHEAGAR